MFVYIEPTGTFPHLHPPPLAVEFRRRQPLPEPAANPNWISVSWPFFPNPPCSLPCTVAGSAIRAVAPRRRLPSLLSTPVTIWSCPAIVRRCSVH